MDFIKQLSSHVLTALLGVNGKEFALGGVFAVVGTTAVAALGGWGIALQLLLFCMVFDYVTGFLSAWKFKSINSDVMFWGGIRKVIVLGVIVFAGLLDSYLIQSGLLSNPILQTAIYYFYIGREGISIIENLGKLNVLVPDVLKDKLAQLKDKQGESNVNKD